MTGSSRLPRFLAIIFTLILVVRPDEFEEIIRFVEDTANYVAPEDNSAYFLGGDSSSTPINYGKFDFIIIGAGTAGGILANRLTEIKDFSVLVVEAGKTDPAISKVLGLATNLANSEYNWGYTTTAQNGSCLANQNQQCPYARGKTLGGSSSINYGLYTRANPKNYDKWQSLGNTGWSFEDCLPYFKKSEAANFAIDIDPELHGFHGAQKISITEDTQPLSEEFVKAFVELGIPEGDYNGKDQYKVSRPQFFLDYNTRSSTAHSYIHPARRRTNFHLSLESLVTKIDTVGRNAVGVEFWRNGTRYYANASREIIVSGGAINSPQVLMLSGIGPKKSLNKLGIDLVADLPVGQNLVDHLICNPLFYRSNYSFYNNSLEENLELWAKNRRPLTPAYGVNSVTYYNVLGGPSDPPDAEVIIMGPPAISSDFGYNLGFIDAYAKPFEILDSHTDFSVLIMLLLPRSVGEVSLRSADPRHFPLINPNYYDHPDDLEIMYRTLKTVLELNNTNAFQRIGARQLIPKLPACEENFEALSKEWWLCVFRYTTYNGFHPIGTTRMGNNSEESVVSGKDLKVHGFDNLRVVDAGVMPTQISGHINVAIAMIAEKIADVIKSEYFK